MRIRTVLLFLVLALFPSCSYYTVRNEFERYRQKEAETFVFVKNQFQWLLQDFTVWNAADFTGCDPVERQARRKFAISKLPILDLDIKEKFRIISFHDKMETRYFLEKWDHLPEYVKYNVDTVYFLKSEKGRILAEFAKDPGEDSMQFVLTVNQKQYKIKTVAGTSKQWKIFQLIGENGEILVTIRKEFSLFTDRMEFDINRLENSLPDSILIAAVTVVNVELRNVEGGYGN